MNKYRSDDLAILYQNQMLADEINKTEVTGADGSKTSSFNVEAVFKGKNAEVFMNKQGYDFRPVLFKFHSDITTEYHPEPHGQITQTQDYSSVESVLSSRYVAQDVVLKNTLTLKSYKKPQYDPPKSFGPMYSMRDQSWTYRKNIYGTSAFGRKAGKTINWLEKNTPWKSFYQDLWKKALK